MKSGWRTIALTAVLLGPAPAAVAATESRPPATNYTPCRVKQTVAPVYPVRALQEGVLRGEALIVVEVDRTSKLGDFLVVAYTHPAFAESAVEALKRWEFKAAAQGEETYVSRIDITFNFEVSGVVVYEKKPIETFQRFFDDERFAFRPYRSAELDQPVRAVHQPGPIYPRQWIEENRRGTVVIEFFIDGNGSVRLPAPADRGDEWLTAAAVAVIKEWKFTPPRRRGEPVIVRAQQAFVFQPPARTP